MLNVLIWANKNNLKYTMLSDSVQFYRMLLLKNKQKMLISSILVIPKTQEPHILLNLFQMLKFLQSPVMLRISFSSHAMLFQYYHQFQNYLQLKLFTTSIQDTLQRLLEHKLESNSQSQLSQLVLDKHSYLLNLKYMLIYLLKKLKSMELTSGLWIQDGLEVNMESERESAFKLQEILLTQFMMDLLLTLNTRLYLFSTFNTQLQFLGSNLKFLTQEMAGAMEPNSMKVSEELLTCSNKTLRNLTKTLQIK